jgi:hypothetical protein
MLATNSNLPNAWIHVKDKSSTTVALVLGWQTSIVPITFPSLHCAREYHQTHQNSIPKLSTALLQHVC